MYDATDINALPALDRAPWRLTDRRPAPCRRESAMRRHNIRELQFLSLNKNWLEYDSFIGGNTYGKSVLLFLSSHTLIW